MWLEPNPIPEGYIHQWWMKTLDRQTRTKQERGGGGGGGGGGHQWHWLCFSSSVWMRPWMVLMDSSMFSSSMMSSDRQSVSDVIRFRMRFLRQTKVVGEKFPGKQRTQIFKSLIRPTDASNISTQWGGQVTFDKHLSAHLCAPASSMDSVWASWKLFSFFLEVTYHPNKKETPSHWIPLSTDPNKLLFNQLMCIM